MHAKIKVRRISVFFLFFGLWIGSTGYLVDHSLWDALWTQWSINRNRSKKGGGVGILRAFFCWPPSVGDVAPATTTATGNDVGKAAMASTAMELLSIEFEMTANQRW